jgi:DNA-binding MarR family transcriptional regulator
LTALPAHRRRDLVQLLTSTERLLGRRIAAVLAAEGHTLDSWRVISLLADDDGLPMTELADRAFLPPATLTKLIDQLTEQNLVYRRGDEIDRRRIRAHLTTRGHRLHERIERGVEATVSTLLAAGPERELLEDLLTQLISAMDGVPATR